MFSAVQNTLCMQMWRQGYHRNEVCWGTGWGGAMRGSQIHSIAPAFAKLLALTLLTGRRHFQIQEADKELAAGRFVFCLDSHMVQISTVSFIWKQNRFGNGYLLTIAPQPQRISKWILAHTMGRRIEPATCRIVLDRWIQTAEKQQLVSMGFILHCKVTS